MATRIDLFKAWLNLVGADAKDTSHIGNEHGCYGFFCPEDVPTVQVPINNTTEMEYRVDCTKCKYNEFWTKEVEE